MHTTVMNLAAFSPSTTAVAGSPFLSAITGLLPLLAFFILLGIFKIKTHWCAIISLALSLIIAILGFHMPINYALLSAAEGIFFGFFPILFVIIAAVWLYNLTESSGRSADVRAAFNIVGRGDQRAQGLLIAFSFCGLLEGLAGFGAPVAIVAAMLVTIGIPPMKAAVATIVGNAINVGFGAMAIPVTTAGKLGDTEPTTVAQTIGTFTPCIAIFIPLILLFILDGTRGIRQLWPAAIVSGAVTAFGHWWATHYFSYELTAVVASLMGFIALSIMLSFWQPTTPEDCASESTSELSFSRALLALMPYWLVIIIFGIAKLWRIGVDIPAFLSSTDIVFPWPGLHGNILTAAGTPSSSTLFTFAWLSSPGALISLSAIIVIAVYAAIDSQGLFPFSIAQGFRTLIDTIVNLRLAILTVATVMGLAYVMNMSGQTGAIGAWLAGTGAAFAFISPVLGWLGTAVTGSATSANALFANLQYTAAGKVGTDPALLLSANTIGAGLGKIVSPQNLAIASSSVGVKDMEPELLRKVAPYSIALLLILCALIGLSSLGLF